VFQTPTSSSRLQILELAAGTFPCSGDEEGGEDRVLVAGFEPGFCAPEVRYCVAGEAGPEAVFVGCARR